MKTRIARYLLFLLLANLQLFPCLHGQSLNVLDWKTDVTLNTFLVQQMQQQYTARRKAFDKAVRSEKTMLVYREAVRQKIIRLFGDRPEQSSLHATVTGQLKQQGYRIEKIVFESFTDHHVTTNLYVPEGRGPFPGVLLFCGHEDVSKATESYQKTAILFAKNGFVVLVIDPISQSERHQLTGQNGKPLTRGGTTEHTLLNEGSNLLGYSTPADERWDNLRALDYLVTRKEVDTTRIGCLGNSGGGMQTMYFAGYERRIKIIAVCSYLATRERTMELTGPADGCAQMPNEGKAGIELSDYLIAAAPKPLLVLAGRYDFIDYQGTLLATEELKKVYAALGQPGAVDLFTYDDGHGISQPKREAAVTWFRRWMYKDVKPVKEAAVTLPSEAELRVTAAGQVNASFTNEISIAKRNLMAFEAFQDARKNFMNHDRDSINQQIRKLLGIEKNIKAVRVQSSGELKKGLLSFHKMILRREGEPPLPLLALYPSGSRKMLMLVLHEGGKNKMAAKDTLLQSFLDQGCVLLLADLRGMGETEDRPELNDPKYYNKEYRNAMLALHIGQPLPGQRVKDVETILEYIQMEPALKNLPVRLFASGTAAEAALHAAVLNKGRIQSLFLDHSILSFKQILEQPLERNWYGYVIPDVLRHYDLTELVKLLEGDHVIFISPGKNEKEILE